MQIRQVIVGLFAAALSCTLLSACGSDAPVAATLLRAQDVGPMVPLPDGGLRYGERRSGLVWDVDATGTRSSAPVADIDVSVVGDGGLLGMVRDDRDRTFASWTAPTGELVVGQIAPGPVRVLWTGPVATDTHLGGRITVTPEKRLLVSVGDLQNRNGVANDDVANGKLITLDPDREPQQRGNAISKGWVDSRGIVYVNDLLWAIDEGFTTEDRLGRVGSDGFVGKPVELGNKAQPLSLAKYGDRELLACLGGSGTLRRYLINDVEALPGRTLGKDCTGDVVELTDSRVAYASSNGISIIDE